MEETLIVMTHRWGTSTNIAGGQPCFRNLFPGRLHLLFWETNWVTVNPWVFLRLAKNLAGIVEWTGLLRLFQILWILCPKAGVHIDWEVVWYSLMHDNTEKINMAMDQYLWKYHLLGGWTSILTQLFWCEQKGYYWFWPIPIWCLALWVWDRISLIYHW